MINLIKLIFVKRELILELVRRELFASHGRHLLGGMWVFANPLLTLIGFFVVFRYLFPSRLPSGSDAEVFLLAGLIQWIVISETLVRSCSTLRSSGNLVKQINFPTETLFVKTVAAALFIQVIMTFGLMALMLSNRAINVQVVPLWVLALAIQAVFMLGTTLLIGAISPFVPDLAEAIGVLARMGLFVTPILYTVDRFGEVGRILLHLNPFSYFAWIHQQAIFYQSFLNLYDWLIATFIAVLALAIGCAVFRAMQPAFTEVL